MKKEFAVVAAFLGPLFLLSLGSAFLPEKVFSKEENRYLASRPALTWSELVKGAYGRKYETWLSDQFPFRNKFIAVKTNADRLMLREDVNDIYFGQDHYYIEKFDTEDLFTERLSENLKYLSGAAEGFGKMIGPDHVKIMLVPSASQILSDKLPPFASPAEQKNVVSQLKEMTADPGMILPVEEELLKHNEESIYYRTDHHWTTLGAYYTYCLYGWEAGFVPWDRERFEEKTVSENFSGTIQSRLGVTVPPDSITLFLPREKSSYNVFYDGMPKESQSLYNEKALKGKDQYSVFLDGNHGLTRIVNGNAGEKEKGRKLLLIKDSFANSFAPFAANHFEEVCMVDLRYFNMKISEFIKNEKITDILVLYQIPGFAKDGNLFKIAR